MIGAMLEQHRAVQTDDVEVFKLLYEAPNPTAEEVLFPDEFWDEDDEAGE